LATRQELEDAIEQVQQGNREMFSLVVESHHVQIRTYLSALVHDRFDAEDLAQQTFIFAYQHITEYETGTHFIAWLKAIAYNHVRDYRSSFQRNRNATRFAAKPSPPLSPYRWIRAWKCSKIALNGCRRINATSLRRYAAGVLP